jgi:hypothetical protein
MMQDYYDKNQLVSVELFRLNQILKKMVRMESITSAEREDLLHKAGLLKQEDGKWLEVSTGAILTLS